MTQFKIENLGLKRSVLMLACLFLMFTQGCGKSETESASKTVSNAVEQTGDAAAKLTEKGKEMAEEAQKSAGKLVDDAKQSTQEAYDAAGNMVEKTTEKAADTYKAAEDMVQKAAGQKE